MAPEQMYRRLTHELEDIDERASALRDFIDGPMSLVLSAHARNLLSQQLRCMPGYLRAAKYRLGRGYGRTRLSAPPTS